MTPPGTLVFDLDGTLVDSVPDLAAALNRLLARRGLLPFDAAGVTGMVGDGVPALIGRAFTARGVAEDAAALPEFLADYTAHAAVATRPYPDVTETLATLAAAGWRMAVCTNKPEAAARAMLGALRLDRWFAAVGGGDSFAVCKPDRGHLLATLAAAGGDPARAVMIGDHHNDVAAAQGAGVASIFAAWGYGPLETGREAGVIVPRFAALPAAITALSRRT